MDLTSFFTGVTDPRRAEGKRTPLPAFLWMSFLAIASGSTGYRAMSRFARSNAAFFQQHFDLRHAMPSHVNFRNLLQELDKQALYEAFNQAFRAVSGFVYIFSGSPLRRRGAGGRAVN